LPHSGDGCVFVGDLQQCIIKKMWKTSLKS